ncbi:MAG TPA: hypothetical protein VJJ81_03170, partial [Candidatus Babeliales bacterium]|nr:hypothetical protein [Candidatus Babeliales bacterium]
SESIRVYLANASLVADLAIKAIAKMIENANMARAMLISPAIFKRFTLNIGLSQDNTLDPVLRYLFQWEEQENDRVKRAGRVRMLATPLPPDED